MKCMGYRVDFEAKTSGPLPASDYGEDSGIAG
jgi:hypothetical protein